MLLISGPITQIENHWAHHIYFHTLRPPHFGPTEQKFWEKLWNDDLKIMTSVSLFNENKVKVFQWQLK